MIYIGLPGASSRTVRYNPAPTQDVVLPPEIFRMNEEVEKTLTAAVMRGNTGEDDSRGYALSLDPDARARQLAVRGYALRHEPILLHVLEESSNAPHRAVAAEALGYARVSKRQISALVGACLDPDDTVRNNAVRALGVLVRAKQAVARAMPADMFIQLLGSGRWTDHNKAVLVLEALSTRRDPALLKQLRQQAVDSLLEMARWRNPDHAQAALAILGRIAGIEEKRLEELIEQQKPDEIVNAVNRLGTGARD